MNGRRFWCDVFLKTVLAAVLLAACDPLPDEAWLKITSFQREGVVLVSLESVVGDDTDDLVDVAVANYSTGSQGIGPGIGITVRGVRVGYRYGGRAFPEYRYPFTLYLPTGTDGPAADETLIKNLPIVPATFKKWLRDPANFPAQVLARTFLVEAVVTVEGRTDEGRELSVFSTFTLSLMPEENASGEKVTAPTLTGSSTGQTDVSLNYSAGGATSSLGHTVEYQFRWDDGEESGWSEAGTASHSWEQAGTYYVKARARCREHTDAESGYSNAVTVTITQATLRGR